MYDKETRLGTWRKGYQTIFLFDDAISSSRLTCSVSFARFRTLSPMMISLSESRCISRRRDAKIISHAYARRGMNTTEVRYFEKARSASLTTARYLHTSHQRSLIAAPTSVTALSTYSGILPLFPFAIMKISAHSFVRLFADGQLRLWQ